MVQNASATFELPAPGVVTWVFWIRGNRGRLDSKTVVKSTKHKDIYAPGNRSINL